MFVSITNSICQLGGRNFAGNRHGAKLIPTPNTPSVALSQDQIKDTAAFKQEAIRKCMFIVNPHIA